jgi:cysteine desulfurase/selenocysteine lyase
MSTAEQPPSLPGEAQLAAGQLPRPMEFPPQASAPTPGVALAGARAPTSPTLPDGDPSVLTQVLARMANGLFTAAPAASAPPSAGVPAPLAASPPAVGVYVPPSVEPELAPTVMLAPAQSVPAPATVTTVPATPPLEAPPAPEVAAPRPRAPGELSLSEAPFSAPLSFAGLETGLEFGPAVSAPSLVPVLDGGPDSPLEGDAPYWLAPDADEPLPRPGRGLALESLQLEPSTDASLRPLAGAPFDPQAIRREFPILQERIHGRRLVWLDNAATTQKPQVVIDRVSHYYRHENSNIHRAAHTLAARATDAYEAARETVRRFLNAPSKQEIVFVRGATEGINLVAQSWGRRHVRAGDEILLTWLEHHANIVPWQQLCAETGAVLRVAPVDDRGELILEEYDKLLGPKTRIVAFSQVSNALGSITPAQRMIALAHRHGAKVLVDGAQAVSHLAVDVQALDCDFYVFSGHKVFAPTGIGVVFGKARLLEEMPPWQGGGNMIQDVTFERTVYQGAPARFEAGTGNIADAIGLGAALDWLSRLGVDNVGRYEHELLSYATRQLAAVPGLTLVGTAAERAGVISFVLAGQKTEEVGGLLDKEGIAVRSGHHCAQPILRRLGFEATVRASLAPYNTREDIDALVDALLRLQAGQAVTR